MRQLFASLTLAGSLTLSAVPASATPIKVDIKKLLDQAENTRPYEYVPARAGWNGPEKPVAAPSAVAGIRENYEAKRWLMRLVIPDPRMLGAFAVAIFGLRLIRRGRDTRLGSATA
jgi:hypothetical protein